MPEQNVLFYPPEALSTKAAGADHVFDIDQNGRTALYNIVMDGDDTETTGQFRVLSRHAGFTKPRERGIIDLVNGPFDLSFAAVGVDQITIEDVDYNGTTHRARVYALEA
jgi:hypothetical protein